MTETTNTPEPTAAPEPTLPAPAEAHPTTAPRAPKRSRSRTALIAGGSALAALILLGGGAAVGAAIADELTDDVSDDTAFTVREDDEEASASSPSAPYGAESSRDLMAVIDAASGIAEGQVVAIDAHQNGAWEVQLLRGSGDETVVQVDPNGAATISSAEPAERGDGTPNGVLDRATVDSVVRAALGEEDGTVIEIEVDDDQVSPHEVSILTGDGRTVTLDLDADFKVVNTEREE